MRICIPLEYLRDKRVHGSECIGTKRSLVSWLRDHTPFLSEGTIFDMRLLISQAYKTSNEEHGPKLASIYFQPYANDF